MVSLVRALHTEVVALQLCCLMGRYLKWNQIELQEGQGFTRQCACSLNSYFGNLIRWDRLWLNPLPHSHWDYMCSEKETGTQAMWCNSWYHQVWRVLKHPQFSCPLALSGSSAAGVSAHSLPKLLSNSAQQQGLTTAQQWTHTAALQPDAPHQQLESR